ncbi:hypothetical protein [Algoriphagus sp.]|uniref:hypothetical protein n=1 Tax=Algoriphagus sp. TaxID=1872435 RepID=UPI00391D05E8
MKKLTFLILSGFLGFVNLADARILASMQATPLYEYTVEVDLEVSISGSGIGLGGGSAKATLVGINYECGFALSSCDEGAQKFVAVKR